MKRGNDNRTGVQEHTSMKDKSGNRNAQQSGRPNPSQNTINPNRGLNEDEQKRTTNQEEEDETTNAYTETSETGRNESPEKDKDSSRSGSSDKKRDQKQ
jgi:hypothetical protein